MKQTNKPSASSWHHLWPTVTACCSDHILYVAVMLACVQQAGIPKAMRHIVMKLAELGWLYNKIRTYVESRSADKAFGLIGQVRPTLEQVENCHHFFFFFISLFLLPLSPLLFK